MHEIYEFFPIMWVIFALLDPDPNSEFGPGSGSTVPIEFGSNSDPDPDPQPCLQENIPALICHPSRRKCMLRGRENSSSQGGGNLGKIL
jgi:hypothetical protein